MFRRLPPTSNPDRGFSQQDTSLTLHHNTTRVLFPRLLIKHLAGCTQAVALLDEILDLLSSFKNTFNRPLENLFRLIQLLLRISQRVRLFWRLPVLDVLKQGWQIDQLLFLVSRVLFEVLVRGPGVVGREFIENLCEEVLRSRSRVFAPSQGDGHHAGRSAVGMTMASVFFDVLADACTRALCNCESCKADGFFVTAWSVRNLSEHSTVDTLPSMHEAVDGAEVELPGELERWGVCRAIRVLSPYDLAPLISVSAVYRSQILAAR
jgi:hypothetical protein